MKLIASGTWASINDGCPIECSVSGSNVAHLVFGDNDIELIFEMESMRALVTAVTAALADMDARYAREEADRASAEEYRRSKVSACT